ncbi:MAG: XisH family protein (plasmid) [Leptolyngbya sp. BL-A-14]
MAKDTFHGAVRRALEKEGWTITADPLEISVGTVDLKIDLAAQQLHEGLLAAERENEKIAVEIKSFVGGSEISEWHTALGQFVNYRDALSEQDPERVLYLAVPNDTYESFFQEAFIQRSVQRYQVSLIVYRPTQQEIALWNPLS